MRTPFRLERSPFSRLNLPCYNHTIATLLLSLHRPFNYLDQQPSRASLLLFSTTSQHLPVAPIMSNPILLSVLEGMKEEFFHNHRQFPQDEIKRLWAVYAAPSARILFDTEAQTPPLGLTSIQGQQMARQSTTNSWAEAAPRRRGSDTVIPVGLGRRYHDAPSSEPMSRKRARTSQYEPGVAATTAISTPLLDNNSWQRDGNAPYCGYTNTFKSGPSFKARRTSAGRTPIKIPEASPNIKVYEPAEYLQRAGALPSLNVSPSMQRQNSFGDDCIPSSSLELPSPFSASPTTTVSERFTNTTPATSAPMSRADSLATSFCGALRMLRANSGFSDMDSSQNMCRQDSCYAPHSDSFSPNAQGVGSPFDQSLLFAHAEGTAIEDSPASMLAVEPLQLPTTLELDTEMKRDVSSSSTPNVVQIQSPSSLDFHTKMTRDASCESNASSNSRISRRSQEQIAQAARPIAPKDVAESPTRKPSSPSLSGGQDMRRQRSAPEPKVLIPKLQYSRQAKEKLKCSMCNKNPDGYRGSHELHRHMALDHNASRTAWVCVDISTDGFLSGCPACESKKPYGQDYNAAAHLRRFHFHPKSEVRRTNVDPEERRGGKGGGKDPPMNECRRWMEKVQVPGKDFMALTDSAGGDAHDDAAEEDEESKEEQGGEDEVVGDCFLPVSVQTNTETLQPQDASANQHAFPVNSSDSLELPMTSDRHFTLPTSDVSSSRLGQYPAVETSFESYFDSKAEGFTSPSIDPAYSNPTLSLSAPATHTFLSNDSADSAQAHDSYANSTPNSLHLPSTMSTTGTAPSLEDFSNFQTSYIPGNVSCRMSPPNNPYPYGLQFPPFR